ncbi:MAG: TIGR01777 family oxidoreductase [Ilumatobacteraceae bacterium]
MHIGITGASGLIGSALTTHLRAAGHEVSALVRDTPSTGQIGWDPQNGKLDPSALEPLDAIVHLAGAGIGDHRWTDEYKQTLMDSRVQGTTLIAESMAGLGAVGPQTLISGSAIGFYGARGDDLIDESSTSGDGFLAEICRQWEAATAPAETAGIRVAHIRTGIVLSEDGGALAKMLPLFKFGLGGRFGRGDQWMSWISISDEVRAITHLLTADLEGAINLTAPNPVRNREFAETLGDVLSRPTLLPVPEFGPKLLLGSELADALLFDGQRVEPTVLQADDSFSFEHPDLRSALRSVLDR